MGRIYRRYGVYDKAQRLLEQALASGRTAFGAEHVRVAQTLNDLGALLTEKGDYAAAEPTLEQALSMRRKLLGLGASRTSPSPLWSSDASTRIEDSMIAPSRFSAKLWRSGGECSGRITEKRQSA